MSTPTYEVYALRYATITVRRRQDNFLFQDDHAANMPLDFFIWLIRGNGRTIVVDTGFLRRDAQTRKREMICLPEEALKRLGVDAATVKDVVISHMHWDHAGGIDAFPQATFHVREADVAFCTGRCMCHQGMRRHFELEHVLSAMRVLWTERMRFHDGVSELAPGITLHEVGGHAAGIQVVRILTQRGWVVLASDTAHYWENLRKRNPMPWIIDMRQMLEGFDTLENLADGPDHIIPGHDPLVLTTFPKQDGNPDIVRVDLEPIAASSRLAAD